MKMRSSKKTPRWKNKIYGFIVWLHEHLYLLSYKKAVFQKFINDIAYLGEGALIESLPAICPPPQKLYIYENSKLSNGAKFFISKEGDGGKCIIKQNTIISAGVSIITNIHDSRRVLGQPQINNIYDSTNDTNLDVIVEEDVWVGANVTILPNVTIGRGSLIGAGSVIRKNVPPYSIVIGNPAKVVAFNYTAQEIIQHEKLLYPENNRMQIDEVKKLFLKRNEYC